MYNLVLLILALICLYKEHDVLFQFSIWVISHPLKQNGYD